MLDGKRLPSGSQVEELDVAVIGAGFAGLYQLDRLRDRGFRVRLFEAGDDIGGIWYWNCYPGARVDSYAPMYQYAYKELWRDWDWSERFPSWQELRAYFHYVDGKLHLGRDIAFHSRVVAGDFDEERRQWVLEIQYGRVVRAAFVVLCTGFASKPYIPDLPGLESFAGPRPHTAQWPQHGLDMTGQRVAVIGAGASGVQVVEEGSQIASQLTVFQRTPNVALPMRQETLDAAAQRQLKAEYPERFEKRKTTFAGFDFDFIEKSGLEVSDEERRQTFEHLWNQGALRFWLGNYMDLVADETLANHAYQFWREKTLKRVKNPRLAEKLAPETPPFPFGTKRHSLERFYYEAFNQANVDLVDLHETPLERITSTGIKTSAGEREFDIIVLATGFDAVTGGITNIDLRTADGRNFADKWRHGIRTQLGMASAGFPNVFFVYGPQSPTAFCNGPTCAELQGEWIVRALENLRTQDTHRIEATPEAEEAWAQHAEEMVNMTLLPKADSWWMGANVPGKKRQTLNYVGGLPTYLDRLNTCARRNYEGFVIG